MCSPLGVIKFPASDACHISRSVLLSLKSTKSNNLSIVCWSFTPKLRLRQVIMSNSATERQERCWQTGGIQRGATGVVGGPEQCMKTGSGNGIFGLGQRAGRTSLQSPATQSGVTEQADASQRCMMKGQAATVTSHSEGKSDKMQVIMVVFTVTVFRDWTEHPDRLCNLWLWRHSKLSRARFETSPVLSQRLDQSFFPTQIFIWCWRKNKVAYTYNIEATAQTLQHGPVMKNCLRIITPNSPAQ